MKSIYPAQAVREVKWLIENSGQSGTLTRPVATGGGTFFGPNETSATTIGTVAVEMQNLPPKDLAELGADAVASVLPGSGVLESDFLAISGIRYRVTALKPHNFFGQVTHVDLHLTRERRDG